MEDDSACPCYTSNALARTALSDSKRAGRGTYFFSRTVQHSGYKSVDHPIQHLSKRVIFPLRELKTLGKPQGSEPDDERNNHVVADRICDGRFLRRETRLKVYSTVQYSTSNRNEEGLLLTSIQYIYINRSRQSHATIQAES